MGFHVSVGSRISSVTSQFRERKCTVHINYRLCFVVTRPFPTVHRERKVGGGLLGANLTAAGVLYADRTSQNSPSPVDSGTK
jgi:hypothetical protein